LKILPSFWRNTGFKIKIQSGRLHGYSKKEKRKKKCHSRMNLKGGKEGEPAIG